MRNRYNQTFKEEAVALALGSDEPVSKIAIDLGLNQQTLGNWVRQAMSESKSISKPGKQDYQTLERELRKARKELALKDKETIVRITLIQECK